MGGSSDGGGASGAGGTGGAGAGGTGAGASDGSLDATHRGCEPCDLPNVKSYGCADAACTIVECADGFVDCDAKPENGCETSFVGTSSDASAGVRAPKVRIKMDGDLSEWSGVSLYPMKLPCTACRSDQPGGQNGEPILNEVPDADDLTAVFGAAWDDGGLYVAATVRDDQIAVWPNPPSSPVTETQDGIELFVDGILPDANPDYSPDVHHLFMDAIALPPNNVSERNQQLQAGDVVVASTVVARCYYIEARLSWSYVMGRAPYTPKGGDVHGFTIAVNDWDLPPRPDADTRPVRQTQLFWVVPGPNYSYQTTGFGTLTLE